MKRDRTVIWRRVLTFRGLLPLMVVALTLALNSCTKGPMLPGEQPDKEYMDFSLELTPPGAYTQTKAMSPAAQNALNRAEVLVFKDNALLYHKTGTVTNIDGVKKRVQVTLKTSQTETDLFDIMVIGNPPAAFGFETYVGKTKDELKAAFNVSATGKWAGTEFVMYGEARQTLIKPTTNNFKIQMLRSLARIDIGVGAYSEASDTWAGLADFKLTEVRVVNSRDKFAAIPSATILNESGNVKVDAPTVPADAVAQGKDAATAIKYSGADITQVGVSTKSAIFIAEAPNTTDRVTLLIGGSYKGGATTYYRVDMCVAGVLGGYDYFNILRNHLYRVTIIGVMGEGFADAQKALEASPLNIKVDMTATPEGGVGGDIIFDGNSYLMTDVSSVVLSDTPDGVKSFDLFNVKAGFVSGTIANVTGTGITTPIALTNGVSKLISVVLPASITSGEYVITVGRLIKKIKYSGSGIIPNSVLIAAGWPADRLPAIGLQIAARGNVLPDGTPAADDPKMQWSTETIETEITGKGLGKGKGNYADLALLDATKYPIGQACKHLGPEWYVPSIDEFLLIYNQRSRLGASHGFGGGGFWSATEVANIIDHDESWAMDFGFEVSMKTTKTFSNYRVRCVREV